MTNQHDKIKSSQDSDIEKMEDIVNGIQNLGADVDNMTTEEMHFLNQRLDELNSALDMWERKNDLIYARLVELLDSNRAIREQMKENPQVTAPDGSPEECVEESPKESPKEEPKE